MWPGGRGRPLGLVRILRAIRALCARAPHPIVKLLTLITTNKGNYGAL